MLLKGGLHGADGGEGLRDGLGLQAGAEVAAGGAERLQVTRQMINCIGERVLRFDRFEAGRTLKEEGQGLGGQEGADQADQRTEQGGGGAVEQAIENNGDSFGIGYPFGHGGNPAHTQPDPEPVERTGQPQHDEEKGEVGRIGQSLHGVDGGGVIMGTAQDTETLYQREAQQQERNQGGDGAEIARQEYEGAQQAAGVRSDQSAPGGHDRLHRHVDVD